MVLVSPDLLLSLIISRSAHVAAANGIISFFFVRLSSIPSHIPMYSVVSQCTTSSSSIHLSVDTSVVSMSWLL